MQWIFQEFRISIGETTVGRELKAFGFAKLSARPGHNAQNDIEAAASKKDFPAPLAEIRAKLPQGTDIDCGGPTKRG
ncbi:hypothetical protein SS05631_c28520 [Sinorhizobium sp. CCBAU 05631]|nr:hypothetical protein SS05631_c28520 [Sinorhizobium sp. CCBAU 05631]